eukprot:scaffold259328_cov20-Prasinocladus_malaysianus.AAC.1
MYSSTSHITPRPSSTPSSKPPRRRRRRTPGQEAWLAHFKAEARVETRATRAGPTTAKSRRTPRRYRSRLDRPNSRRRRPRTGVRHHADSYSPD